MEYLLYIVCFLAGAYIGYKVNDAIYRITFGEMLKQAGVTDKDLDKFVEHWKPQMEEQGIEPGLPKVEVKIEQHSNVLYAFRKDTDQFLGQGKDREELLTAIAARYKDITLVISEQDGGNLLKVNT